MLFNIRAAAAAALAFLAVPSIATDPGSIVNAIHQLTAKTIELQNSCQSISRGSITESFGGIFSIGDSFTQVVATAKTTWSIVQSAKGISVTFTEEESIQITQAWGDCLDAQHGVLGILNDGTDLFSRIAQSVLGAVQQLQSIFDNIQTGLLAICPPPQHPQLQDWWPPINSAFDDCINQFGAFGGGPGPALPPGATWPQMDHQCDEGCDGDGYPGGWRRKRAFVA